jgi:arylsulfatase A-like enzyme
MDKPPNIILINCDDLGYGDLGCYGSILHRTPAIDRLSAEGIKLSNFYMASPLCSPSRGAMLTGCYPLRIGFDQFDGGAGVLFPGFSTGLNSNELTISRLLKSQGYHTKLVGKWHCGDQLEFLPTRHGFDEYFGLPYSNDMGRQVTRTHLPPLPLMRNEAVIQLQPDQAGLTERYVQECLDFIRQNQRHSFFLYFAHMHVHLPLYAASRFMKHSLNGVYGATVEEIDWSVSAILHELNVLDLSENTWVIFTSDNGARGDYGGSNLPLRGRKGTCWEGGQRVPCLMRWPGVFPSGEIRSNVSSAMDFLPSIASVVGYDISSHPKIDGVNRIQVWQSGVNESSEIFFYYLKDELRAVRSGKWKLHLARDGSPVKELYDLRVDIGEKQNIIDTNPEIVSELEVLAESIRLDLGDSITRTKGTSRRLPGKVVSPQPLAVYDESYPYICAEYDLPDAG